MNFKITKIILRLIGAIKFILGIIMLIWTFFNFKNLSEMKFVPYAFLLISIVTIFLSIYIWKISNKIQANKLVYQKLNLREKIFRYLFAILAVTYAIWNIINLYSR
ncbi:MAG: hypothetical protein RLZZ210_794 [Pseudomonadota bacterium]|jgi:membrane-bound ClpP family serine protease